MAEQAAGEGNKVRRRLLLAGGAVAVLAVLLLAAGDLAQHVHGPYRVLLPLVRAALVAATGWVVSGTLERAFREARFRANGKRMALVRVVLRLTLYTLVLFGVLGALGLSPGGLAFGGAFLTVVIGLAGQSVLGNVLSGMVLVFTHPFEVGDSVTLLPAGYAGTVMDLTLLHTVLRQDDGSSLVIPSATVLQAAIHNHGPAQPERHRWVLEGPGGADAGPWLARVEAVARALGAEGVQVVDASPGVTRVAVSLEAEGTDAQAKDRFLRALLASAAPAGDGAGDRGEGGEGVGDRHAETSCG